MPKSDTARTVSPVDNLSHVHRRARQCTVTPAARSPSRPGTTRLSTTAITAAASVLIHEIVFTAGLLASGLSERRQVSAVSGAHGVYLSLL